MEDFIYKFQIQDKSLCDRLIEYHKNNTEYKGDGETTSVDTETSIVNKKIKNSIDVNFHNSSKNLYIKEYFNQLSLALKEYIHKFNLFHYKIITEYVNVISQFPSGGGYKVFHSERNTYSSAHRCFVYMTYLNNIKEGGETEFLYQKMKIKPKKGLTLIWPTDFTHTHRGIPAPKETKYIATGWYKFIP